MRFYPHGDINNYWEFPSAWSLYCRHPHKSWKRRPLQSTHTIAYWRDLQGTKMPFVKQNDLYFSNWPLERIRPASSLPHYYCVGDRFIVLEKAFPAGFKCAKLPLNLKEARELREYEKQLAKTRQAQAKMAKKMAKAQTDLERKKKEMRGKNEK